MNKTVSVHKANMGDAKILFSFQQMYMRDRLLVDKMSAHALERHLVKEWENFARKQIATLNLMVLPRVSNKSYEEVRSLIFRIEDTVRNYDTVRGILKAVSTSDRPNVDLIVQAHEYIIKPDCMGCEQCGRHKQANMFTVVKRL
jgi:hypothetical protein